MIFKICVYIIAAYGVLFIFNAATCFVYRVDGASMSPTYKSGQYLICRRIWWKIHRFKPGKVYTFKPPQAAEMQYVKRLIKITDEGKLWFEGDNKANSFDSRRFGAVDKNRVVAKVIMQVPSYDINGFISRMYKKHCGDNPFSAVAKVKLEKEYTRAKNRKARRKIEKKWRRAGIDAKPQTGYADNSQTVNRQKTQKQVLALLLKELLFELLNSTDYGDIDEDNILLASYNIEVNVTAKEFANEYRINDLRAARERLDNAFYLLCTNTRSVSRKDKKIKTPPPLLVTENGNYIFSPDYLKAYNIYSLYVRGARNWSGTLKAIDKGFSVISRSGAQDHKAKIPFARKNHKAARREWKKNRLRNWNLPKALKHKWFDLRHKGPHFSGGIHHGKDGTGAH